MKHLYRVFLALCLAVCLLPFAGMAVRPTVTSAENRVLSSLPALKTRDGRVNTAFFSQLEQYFTEHFAFRNELVCADSAIQAELFHVSANEKVIVGREGWLYYASTLPDFEGSGQLTEREVHSLAHNLTLVSRFVQSRGADFLLAIAPNKNTLYGAYMPYYTLASDAPHSFLRLQALLAEQDFPYADLYTLLAREDEILYHRQDSHWNSRGALLAFERMMDRLALPHEDFASQPVTRALDHEGDLSRMLFTFYGKKGAEYHYATDGRYTVVEATGQTGDAWIETAGAGGRGTLLMFRDSFGDALLPFFAASFERAYFTKEAPYGLETLMDRLAPGTVIAEKAERNLADYLDMPPLLAAPELTLETPVAGGGQADAVLSLRAQENDPRYLCLQGTLTAVRLEPADTILAEIDGRIYDCYQTRGEGFLLYLRREALPQTPLAVRVLVAGADGTTAAVWSGTLEEET